MSQIYSMFIRSSVCLDYTHLNVLARRRRCC